VVLGALVLSALVIGALVLGPLVRSHLGLDMSRTLSPGQWTFLLSSGLAVAAVIVTLRAGSGPILDVHLRVVVAGLALGGLFLFAEQFLMNIEFRRQAHSFTLAGVPLVLGVLSVSPETFVLVRVMASLIAFAWQRVSADKAFYNGAAYAFEAAADAALVQLLIGPRHDLDPWTAVVLILVLAAVDQLMSLLVLVLIRLHNGPLSRRDVLEVLAPAVVLSLITSVFAFTMVILLQRGILGAGLVLVLITVGTLGYRGHASTRRRHQALTLVHEFVTGGVGAESLESLAEELLSRIRRLLRATTAEVMIVDSHGGDQVVGAAAAVATSALTLSVGEDDHLTVSRREIDRTDWILQRAVADEEPMLAARTTKDRALRRWLTDRDLRDAVMVALPQSSGLSGTLTVPARLGETATFTEDDLTLLQTLTGHLAVALRSTRLVEKLGYDATHDSLTGLSNRGHLSSQIDNVLSTPGHEAAVLLLDLDRFKEVNDALGHDVGDRLLTVVGDRLRNCLPSNAVVARLGGDEFAVLLPDLPGGPDQVAELAERVADTLAQPVQFEEAMLTPEASIGVAVTTRGKASTDLLRQADTAMYEAKANDRRVAFYGPDMDRGRVERLALLADLRLSLSTHPEQFVLHYQPKIDLQTGAVSSVEALVRWNHPTLGVVPPDRFVPLAESTGLIQKLTPLVLEAALRECATWSADAITVSVAVNLSARNISDPRLPQRVAQALTDAGVPAERLILEITESSVMGDPEQTMPVLHQLRDLGTCLSLDDFGTGYSSLSYLQRLPVGEVKIDRSFVLGLASDNRDNSRALIRSIATLGATLGLRIVAEGVEDQATLDELRILGCHVAQGYHISRPLAAADLIPWLTRESPDTRPVLRLLTANS
jgi:diguanylate cyclase (GGDEF)-like protein